MYFSHCFLIIEGRMGHVNPPNRQASLVILLLPYLHIVVVVIVVVGGLSENSLRQRRRGGNCWSRGIIIEPLTGVDAVITTMAIHASFVDTCWWCCWLGDIGSRGGQS